MNSDRLHEARLDYRLDWSRVPSWITSRDVTLIVHIGPALDVVAMGDGQMVPCLYDGQRALVTTHAEELQIYVTAPSLPLESMGSVSLATFREDKLWALSLTLDDGFVSQVTTAKTLLDRYDYTASVAVIGTRIGVDFQNKPYASAAQLQGIVADGWQLANHSNNHLYAEVIGAETDIFEDVRAANQAIMNAVPGYVPRMFTAPFADDPQHEPYDPAVRAHAEELGIYLIQTRGWQGAEADPGSPMFGRSPAGIGRTQLLHDGSQFDGVYTWMAEHPGKHLWLSLHTHEVYSVCDCVEIASDRLYYSYGLAGTDEVWVAPAPTVYEYLLARDGVQVAETGKSWLGTPPLGFALPEPAPTPQIETVVLRQGRDGYVGTRDATITQFEPEKNQGSDSGLIIHTQQYNSSLVAFDIGDRVPQNAIVDRALLRLYALDQSVAVTTCFDAHALVSDWDEQEVTWAHATASKDWEAPGARAPQDSDPEHTGLRGLAIGVDRWYEVDVTPATQAWTKHPQSNYGVLLVGSGDTAKRVALASSEYPVVERRPALEIRYHIPDPVDSISPVEGDATLVGGLLIPARGEAPSPRWSLPVTVTLAHSADGQVAYRAAFTTNEQGEFVMRDLAPGRYDVLVDAYQALPVLRQSIDLVSGANLIKFGPLVMGDAVPDGYIVARDWTTMLEAFGAMEGEATYNAGADLNNDGKIDILDMAIIHESYGRYGQILQTGEPEGMPSHGSAAFAASDSWPPTAYAGALQLPIIGDYALPNAAFEARDVAIKDQRAYVAVATFNLVNPNAPFAMSLDVSDPTDPRHVAQTQGLSREPDEIWIEGDRAYVAHKGWGVDVLGIGGPSQVDQLGRFLWTVEDRPIAKGLHVLNQRLYIADERYGLQIVDVSNAASPQLLGAYDQGMFGEGVWSDGRTAYVAADRDELLRPVVFAVDVTDPTKPRFITKVIPTTGIGRAVDVELADDVLYVAAEGGGVFTFDVTTPQSPIYLGQFDSVFAQKLRVVGDTVFLADDTGGLVVLDAANPASLQAVGACDTPGKAYGVAAAGGYAYVADGTAGLQVVDLRPLTPSPAATATPTITATATRTPTPSVTPTKTPVTVALIPLIFR